MREQILTFLEKNSKIDLQELAILLGSSEAVIANEVARDGKGAGDLRIPYTD